MRLLELRDCNVPVAFVFEHKPRREIYYFGPVENARRRLNWHPKFIQLSRALLLLFIVFLLHRLSKHCRSGLVLYRLFAELLYFLSVGILELDNAVSRLQGEGSRPIVIVILQCDLNLVHALGRWKHVVFLQNALVRWILLRVLLLLDFKLDFFTLLLLFAFLFLNSIQSFLAQFKIDLVLLLKLLQRSIIFYDSLFGIEFLDFSVIEFLYFVIIIIILVFLGNLLDCLIIADCFDCKPLQTESTLSFGLFLGATATKLVGGLKKEKNDTSIGIPAPFLQPATPYQWPVHTPCRLAAVESDCRSDKDSKAQFLGIERRSSWIPVRAPKGSSSVHPLDTKSLPPSTSCRFFRRCGTSCSLCIRLILSKRPSAAKTWKTMDCSSSPALSANRNNCRNPESLFWRTPPTQSPITTASYCCCYCCCRRRRAANRKWQCGLWRWGIWSRGRGKEWYHSRFVWRSWLWRSRIPFVPLCSSKQSSSTCPFAH